VTRLEDYTIETGYDQVVEIRCAQHGYFDLDDGKGGWPSLRDIHHAVAAHEHAHHTPLIGGLVVDPQATIVAIS